MAATHGTLPVAVGGLLHRTSCEEAAVAFASVANPMKNWPRPACTPLLTNLPALREIAGP